MPKLAIRGGTPVRDKAWPEWPIIGEAEKAAVNEMVPG